MIAEMAEAADTTVFLDGNGRSCGPCTACCTVHNTVSPGWERCPHDHTGNSAGTVEAVTTGVAAGGCNIYADRPHLCREYTCLWRAGVLEGDERRRPDRIGLVMEISMDGPPHFVAWEAWPGARDGEQARHLVGRLEKILPVVVVEFGGGHRL